MPKRRLHPKMTKKLKYRNPTDGAHQVYRRRMAHNLYALLVIPIGLLLVLVLAAKNSNPIIEEGRETSHVSRW